MMTFCRSILAFKIQMCSQRIKIEKNTIMEGEGSEAGWWKLISKTSCIKPIVNGSAKPYFQFCELRQVANKKF